MPVLSRFCHPKILSMSNSYYVIASLLEKLGKIDSDFRFMALSDLLVELSKPDFVMDQSTEQKITNAVLNSIKDSNSEVQNQAVKCIGPLTMKCRNGLGISKQVLELMDVQGSNIWDVALISLKNVMEATSQDSPSIVEILTLVVSKLIREMKKEHIDLELIDLFNLCIQRFSAAFAQLDVHEKVFEVLMMLMVSSRPVIRKRTILCIASFSRCCRVELFLKIVVTLMKLLDTVEEDKIESILNALSAMCNTDSAKMSEFVNDLLIKVLGLVKHENDQIKEACLNTFECLVRLNLLIETQISQVTIIALELLTYDPHYNDEEEMMDDDDIMSQSSFNDSTDEEDETWKVRRASAKMLAEIAAADLLESKYDLLSKPLMDRFNERVEIVRIDVINAFRMLINSKATYIGGQESKRRKLDIGAVDSKWHQARESLAKDVDAIIILLVRQFNGCSLSTIEIGFQLLSEITQVLNGGLSTSINQLKSPIESILTHSRRDLNISATLKIKLLGFIKSVLNYHQAHTIWTFLEEISSSIIHSTLDKFYKVRFESLRLIQEIVASIHTSLQDSPMGHPDYLPLVEKLLKGSLAVLNNNEIEPEVLEQAIINCSMIIAKFTGIDSTSLLKSQLLPNIINNLTMDSLRDSCLLSINDLVKSVDSIDWKPLITSIEPLLKGTSKHTSSLAVSCLVTLVSMLNDQIEIGVYEDLLNSVPYLLDNSELYLALDLLTSMVPNGYPSMKFKNSLIRDVLPKVVGMVATQSHLFGGAALDSLIKLWGFLCQFDTHYSIYSEFVPKFIAAARSNQIRKESFSIVAKCIARGYSLLQFSSLISDLLNIIKASNTSENMLIFCLYCVGEIGTLW